MQALNGHHAVRVGGAGYASLVLGMGPAGYWRLADTGTTAAAVVGPAGAYSGTFTTGHLSVIARESATAARFGGGAMTATIPAISPPITVAVWMIITGGGGNRHVFDLRGSGLSVLAYRSGVPDLFARGTGAGVPTPQPAMAPLIGEWALYAGVLTGSQVIAYRNGAAQNASAFSAAAAFTTVRVASANPSGDAAHGDCCEAMVFGRALSAAELLTLYLAGINGA